MEKLSYKFAEAKDMEEIQQLLKQCGLPTEGISPHLKHFILAGSKHRTVGVIGLEAYDGIGLLRSLAVVPEARRKGIGKDLYLRLRAHAHINGIHELNLLTVTAEGFFKKLGFRKISRDLAPEPLKATVCKNKSKQISLAHS